MASRIIDDEAPAAGVMVSTTELARRKSNFEAGDWIMDSGAFTEVARYGGYRSRRGLRSPVSAKIVIIRVA